MKFLKGSRSTFSKAISPLKEVLINCAFVSCLFAVAGILTDLFQRFHFQHIICFLTASSFIFLYFCTFIFSIKPRKNVIKVLDF